MPPESSATMLMRSEAEDVDLPGLLDRVEFLRLDANRKLDQGRRGELGQFMTPAPVAALMGGLARPKLETVQLLDAGAGVGSLTAAWVSQVCSQQRPPKKIHAVAFELDRVLVPYLETAMRLCHRACAKAGVEFTFDIQNRDFIRAGTESAVSDLFRSSTKLAFDSVIMNPPYRKIGVASDEKPLLDQLGAWSPNLYTAFLSVAVRLLVADGELIAITPRSFCNGTYFRPFRRDFLGLLALDRIHVFDSRDRAFSGDDVLQENVIFRATRTSKPPKTITLSVSSSADSHDTQERRVQYEQVVHPGDPDQFIRLTTDASADQVVTLMESMTHSLDELGIKVSTGKVVDFRAKDSLRKDSGPDTVPLIYPGHFHLGYVKWPRLGFKKANALVHGPDTENLLVPAGVYVLVKRFSSKEEPRRVVAAIYDPARMPDTGVGFENHLNYYHQGGRGLPMDLARGLAAFLNSTVLDMFFRQLSGHTQVNAGDLRNLKYPTRDQLLVLGERIGDASWNQEELDELVAEALFPVSAAKAINPRRVAMKIEEAINILKQLDMPREQLNERSGLTLLALADLRPDSSWSDATAPLCGITPMMNFFEEHYGKSYAPNSRETVRRFTVHQFQDAGFIVANPDKPDRPTNSPKAVYQLAPQALELLRSFGTLQWGVALNRYLAEVGSLRAKYHRERQMQLNPVTLNGEKTVTLSPGGQNVLVKKIIDEFCQRFTPGGCVVYLGDTDNKFAYYGKEYLADLGVVIEGHGKMPDVVVHHVKKN